MASVKRVRVKTELSTSIGKDRERKDIIKCSQKGIFLWELTKDGIILNVRIREIFIKEAQQVSSTAKQS